LEFVSKQDNQRKIRRKTYTKLTVKKINVKTWWTSSIFWKWKQNEKTKKYSKINKFLLMKEFITKISWYFANYYFNFKYLSIIIIFFFINKQNKSKENQSSIIKDTVSLLQIVKLVKNKEFLIRPIIWRQLYILFFSSVINRHKIFFCLII
jgi:hypothetical protein